MPTPAQAAIEQSKSSQNVPMVKFPGDLGEFYISFDFYDYRTFNKLPPSGTNAAGENTGAVEPSRNVFSADKANVKSAIAETGSFARVALPIPNNLIDHFQVEWGAEQLGLVGGLMGEAWQGGQNLINSVRQNGIAGSMNAGYDQITAEGQNPLMSNESTAVHMARRRVAAIGSPLFGQVTDLAFGVAENPNLVMLFRGPTLKQHSFSWKLIARTPEESRDISRIIAIFKRAMHPAKLNATTSAFLKYPSECLAEFHSPSKDTQFLYAMRPTVIENVTVNYAPNGLPSFYAGTYDTVGVQLDIKLQETSYYLRDSFDNASEYGSDGFNVEDLRRTPTGTDDDEGETD